MLKTFSIGGVHPHENKLSAHQPIITAEVPAKAVILLGRNQLFLLMWKVMNGKKRLTVAQPW